MVQRQRDDPAGGTFQGLRCLEIKNGGLILPDSTGIHGPAGNRIRVDRRCDGECVRVLLMRGSRLLPCQRLSSTLWARHSLQTNISQSKIAVWCPARPILWQTGMRQRFQSQCRNTRTTRFHFQRDHFTTRSRTSAQD